MKTFDVEAALRLHTAGHSSYAIARELGFLSGTVRYHLKKSGVAVRSRSEAGTARVALEDELRIVATYQNGSGITTLARDFGFGRTTIFRVLRRQGISIRPQEISRRRYQFNESAFDQVSEASAYWTGFMMTDGTIGQRRQGNEEVTLGIAAKDILHLEAFRKFLGATHPIHHAFKKMKSGKIHEQVRLTIRSRRLSTALAGFGVVPNKTRRTQVIGLERNKDFWRGVMDGDGSLAFYTMRGVVYPRVSLLGSAFLLRQFVRFAKNQLDGFDLNMFEHCGTWQVQCQDLRAIRLTNCLYKDCVTALPRKMILANKILAFCL